MEIPLDYAAEPEIIKNSCLEIGGKAAGICYMPDNYLSEGIQDKDNAVRRAKRNAISGHYSVFEHCHISFVIETSKIMAMILNSMRYYATSEKSARYTIMNPETEIENEMYEKWNGIFGDLISAYYVDRRTPQDIDKLSRENARYMISVFTPTTMEHTLSFNRAILTCGWLDDLANAIQFIHSHQSPGLINSIDKNWDNFYVRVADECTEMAEAIRSCIGITKEDPILKDHKDIGIEFFRTVNYINKTLHIGAREDSYEFKDIDRIADAIDETYSDNYVSKFKASFACVAQNQRHRTLSVTINLPRKLDCYVPKIIRGSIYEDEWRRDFKALIDQGVVPQCTLLDVIERGRFEDFVLKCKERLCNRAQLEIMEATKDQVVNFALHSKNLSELNDIILKNMVEVHESDDGRFLDRIEVLARCRFSGYICNEPCGLSTAKINYYRNI